MAGDFARIGQPARATRLDLTLGEDSDGDGIPDAWELALIAALGGNLSLADIRPGEDSDGDGISNLDEYLAGTYAFDPAEGFALALVGFTPNASILEFLALRGRSYTLQASTDLQIWTPVPFRLAGTEQPLITSYYTTELRKVQVEVPLSITQTHRYFRAMVQ